MWLLIDSIMQIYNEKEYLSKENYKMYSFRSKEGTRMYIGTNPVFKAKKNDEKKPDAKWNAGSYDLRARPHPAKLVKIN